MNQRKCRHCGTWNDQDLDTCSKCKEIISPTILAKIARVAADQKREAQAIKNASKFEKWMARFENSPKPINKILFKLISILFTIHMAIMSFFIWLIALISG